MEDEGVAVAVAFDEAAAAAMVEDIDIVAYNKVELGSRHV